MLSHFAIAEELAARGRIQHVEKLLMG